MADGYNDKFSPGTGKESSDFDHSDNEDSMIPDLGVENIRSVDKKAQSFDKGTCVLAILKLVVNYRI